MNADEFVARVTNRLEQHAQGVKFPAPAVFSILGDTLQKLADQVAADPSRYAILYRAYSITLGAGGTAGQDPVTTLSPTLLLSEEARKWWRVTMTGVRFPLSYRPNRTDLDNPPPISDPDYYYYAIFAGNVVVRDSQGEVPTVTALQFNGNYVPLISDPMLDKELKDDLFDVGTALLLGVGSTPSVAATSE